MGVWEGEPGCVCEGGTRMVGGRVGGGTRLVGGRVGGGTRLVGGRVGGENQVARNQVRVIPPLVTVYSCTLPSKPYTHTLPSPPLLSGADGEHAHQQLTGGPGGHTVQLGELHAVRM